jgi:hypothetical protein
MSKKPYKTRRNPGVAEDTENQPNAALAMEAELNGPGRETLTPPATPELPLTPVKPAPQPLAPLAELWPKSSLGQEPAKRPQAPNTEAPAAPFAAALPKYSLDTTPTRAKPPAQPTATKPPEKAPARVKEPKPSTPRTGTVRLSFFAPEAKQVSVCGDFNDWDPDATPLKAAKDGHWETKLILRPGRYLYKYVADGEWLHDPNAPESVANEHGSLNSVLEVRA